MATSKEIATDLKRDYGALVSIKDLIEYSQMSRTWWCRLLKDVQAIGKTNGKRYFYLDVAEKIANR